MKATVPFTNQKVELTDPKEVLMAVGMLAAGFALFAGAEDLGTKAKSIVFSTLGIGSEGEEQGVDIL